jgi:hypothetical protein
VGTRLSCGAASRTDAKPVSSDRVDPSANPKAPTRRKPLFGNCSHELALMVAKELDVANSWSRSSGCFDNRHRHVNVNRLRLNLDCLRLGLRHLADIHSQLGDAADNVLAIDVIAAHNRSTVQVASVPEMTT